MTSEPLQYLEAHIREALATDDRTNFLDPEITIAGGKVFLMGSVESDELRAAMEAVVREVAPPDMTIVNELCVEHYDSPAASAGERI